MFSILASNEPVVLSVARMPVLSIDGLSAKCCRLYKRINFDQQDFYGRNALMGRWTGRDKWIDVKQGVRRLVRAEPGPHPFGSVPLAGSSEWDLFAGIEASGASSAEIQHFSMEIEIASRLDYKACPAVLAPY